MKLESLLFVLAGVALVFGNVSIAASETAPWDRPFQSEPAELLEAVQGLTTPPDTDLQLITMDNRLHFDEQGRATRTRYMVYRLLSAGAVDSWGSVESAWSPWFQERPVFRARVVSADGTEYQLDPSTVAELPREEGTGVLSDRRVLSAPLPALTPGAVVEEQIVTRETRPFFDDGSVHLFNMAWTIPLERIRLTVDAPRELTLNFHRELLPDLEPERAVEEDRVVWTFERINPPEGTPPEVSMPAHEPVWPRIRVATGRSWNEVATAYSEIVDTQLGDSAKRGGELAAVARQVLADLDAEASDRDGKIAALLAWLQERVRYTGLQFGEAAIVPYSPTAILERRYGDCKDKATVLVGLLRAAGFDASVALLSAGPGQDIQPQMVGLGGFDHAIVHVAAEGDEEEVWIDPTDRFARAGELPLADQNRLALIATSTTEQPRLTPQSSSADNGLKEQRDIYLEEIGPGRVIERSWISGSIESAYRYDYSQMTTADRNDALGSYALDYYGAEEVLGVEMSPVEDLTQPLQLSVEVDGARIAFTDLAEAAVAIAPTSLVYRLPDWMLQQSDEPVERRSAMELLEPYHTEWTYRIHPPEGYRIRHLPDDEQRQLGPAVLSYDFETLDDGTVQATLRFDTVQSRFTAEETQQLVKGVREVRDENPILFSFEQVGEAHLAIGQIREALAEFRRLAAAQPERALPRTRIARALLEAGLGQAARAEAQKAVEMEPGLATAHQTLGIVLNHDMIGRLFGPGWDLAGAEAAYRQAKQLEPDAQIHRQNLAVLLEYNEAGQRYAPDARLDKAIDEYRELRAQDDSSLDTNLLLALLRAERFDEVLELGRELDLETRNQPILLAATAATRGAAPALREARRIQDDSQRSETLSGVGGLLLQLRRYEEASQMLKAAAKGAPNAAELLGRANVLDRTRRADSLAIDPTQPKGFVQTIFTHTVSRDPSGLLELYSDVVREDLAPEEIEVARRQIRQMGYAMEQAGVPLSTIADITLSTAEVLVDGDDDSGYRSTLIGLGGEKETYYFVRQADGTLGLTTLIAEGAAVGKQALAYLDRGETEAALAWLTRAIGEQEIDRTEVLARPTARVLLDPWIDQPAPPTAVDPAILRVVAAVMMATEEVTAQRALELLEGAEEIAPPPGMEAETFGHYMQLSRSLALTLLDRSEEALTHLAPVRKAYPDSELLMEMHFSLLVQLKAWDEARTLVTRQLEKDPDSIDSRIDLARLHTRRDELAEANAIYEQLVAEGESTSIILNNLAWGRLVQGVVDDKTIEYAQRAVQLGQQKDYASLNTLAAVYAEAGRTQEARDILLHSIRVAGQDELLGADWYVLGRMAEHFRVPEAAIQAYRKIEGDEEDSIQTSYKLAQRRLQALEKNAGESP